MEGVSPGRGDGACMLCSLLKELADNLYTYASPINPKGGSGKELAGASGLRFLPLAFLSFGMGPPDEPPTAAAALAAT
jgi:hypothetical protein